MEQEIPRTPVALIVGVTGMAGISLAEALTSPTALGGPWLVYGAARGFKPTWLAFRYPGTNYTWEHFCDVSDARVLAEQQIWAAVTDGAKNHAFYCTNGDVFTWKCLWKVLCEVFDVDFVPFDENEKFDWVVMMKEKGRVWDEIVETYGLYKTNMEEIVSVEAVDVILHFGFQFVSSMNKSREFGFVGYADTLKNIGMWVGGYRGMKIMPQLQNHEWNQ
ncbi:hypothetical protein CMV_010426 [Castanea mollissima]|uniref:Iridoid synthase n=1 Tax=Castanea mollissima TaxID=60419 RepID=A0A8J4RCN3_9ROSI|nr:hypothetical protein CMV_010426 [Castanea mollissima]